MFSVLRQDGALSAIVCQRAGRCKAKTATLRRHGYGPLGLSVALGRPRPPGLRPGLWRVRPLSGLRRNRFSPSAPRLATRHSSLTPRHSPLVPRPSPLVPRHSSLVTHPSSLVPRPSPLTPRPSSHPSSLTPRPSSLVTPLTLPATTRPPSPARRPAGWGRCGRRRL